MATTGRVRSAASRRGVADTLVVFIDAGEREHADCNEAGCGGVTSTHDGHSAHAKTDPSAGGWMEPPSTWALRRAPCGRRDGLGGDDDRTERLARVDEDRLWAKHLFVGAHALAATDGVAAAALGHCAAAEGRRDHDADGTCKGYQHRAGVTGMGEQRAGPTRHEAERKAGCEGGKACGPSACRPTPPPMGAGHGRGRACRRGCSRGVRDE